MNLRLGCLTKLRKIIFPCDGRNIFNKSPSLLLYNKIHSDTQSRTSVREEFLRNMQNHFQFWGPEKCLLGYVASKCPENIDINVNHNDYLQLSFDPRLQSSSKSSLELNTQQIFKEASDYNHSAIFLKPNALQYQLSDILAKKLLNKESVYLTQSGYAANYDLLRSLVIPSKTHVYIDTAAHHSLWQGASLGIIHKIKHRSLEDLKENLKKYGSGVIVIDSLYSARGAIADIPEICNLRNEFGCMLVVDESHALGVYGPHGSGLVAHFKATDSVDFIIGSLAKAFCVRAGFVAGRAAEVLYTREISSTAIFSTSLLHWDLYRLQRAIEVIYNADKERSRLFDISNALRKYALELDFDVPETPLPSPILSIVGGPRDFTKKLQTYFENAGISGSIFPPPATPVNRTLYRLSLNSGLSDQDVKRIMDVLKLIKEHQHEFPYAFKESSQNQ